MAKTETRNKEAADSVSAPDPPSVDGQEGLDRFNSLTRRLMAVPKSEVPKVEWAKPKKRAKRKRA